MLAVLGDLGVVTVGPARLRGAHVTKARGEALAEGAVGGGSRLQVMPTGGVGDAQQDEQGGQQDGEGAPAGRGVGLGAGVPGGGPAEPTPSQVGGGGDQHSRVARPARHDLVGYRLARDPLCGLDYLAHADAVTRTEVESARRPTVDEVQCRRHVSRREIGNMDVVTDTGSVVC